MSLIGGGDAARQPVEEGDPLPPLEDLPESQALAIDRLYRKQQVRLLGFLRRRAPDGDAEDIVQQSFARFAVYEAETGRAIHSEGLLFRIAGNIAIDAWRARQSRSHVVHVPPDELEMVAHDQLATLEARDVLHRLEHVLQRLKPRTREIFLAHRIDGYTYGEIAARTGLSVKGVEKHMSLAIGFIDQHLRSR